MKYSSSHFYLNIVKIFNSQNGGKIMFFFKQIGRLNERYCGGFFHQFVFIQSDNVQRQLLFCFQLFVSYFNYKLFYLLLYFSKTSSFTAKRSSISRLT